MITKILASKEKRILVVEDDNIARAQMEEMFRMVFKEVHGARNGEEGYEIYKIHSPDIIITDIKMHGISGLKLAELIRAENRDVPIIFLTSFAEPDLMEKAEKLSISAYLLKPIDFQKLMSTMFNIFEKGNQNINLIPVGNSSLLIDILI